MSRIPYPSLKAIHRIYWRHTVSHWLELLCLAGGVLFLCLHLMVFLTNGLEPGPAAINALAAMLAAVTVWVGANYLRSWAKSGFRLSSFFHQWEQRHPEVANRASMLVYAESRESEIERLGYSRELIAADDRWLRGYIESQFKHVRYLPPSVSIGLFVLAAGSFWLLTAARPDWTAAAGARVSEALWVRSAPDAAPSIEVPAQLAARRGESIRLTAKASGGELGGQPRVYIESAGGWRAFTANAEGNGLEFEVPSVRREFAYYFTAGGTVSNRGVVTPLDPPSVKSGRIAVTPPEYTGIDPYVIETLRASSAPEGSRIAVAANTGEPVVSARFHIGGATQSLQPDGGLLQAEFTAERPVEYSFSFEDANGMAGASPVYSFTPVPDATPTVEVLKPAANAAVPSDMMIKAQVKVRDDYRIERVASVYRVNQNEEAKMIPLWRHTPEAAEIAGGATEFYILYDWDLSKLELFPGDEVTYHVEAWDNDALHGSKSGRSAPRVIRYPSLSDLLADLDESEERQVDELDGLVESQKEVSEEIRDTVERITGKISSETFDEENPESLWTEQQELRQLKEKQEELVEKAKQIEEELQKYEESVGEELTPEEREDQGFTPETLEKMERIRELMDELVDNESRQMLQNIEDAIQQMSEQITEEQLQEMQFSVDNFEQQLDRTLSMLETTFQARQLEGLRQSAKELAQRQDHLQRQTGQLAAEERALAEREAQLNREMAQSENQEGQPGGENQPEGQQQEADQGEGGDQPEGTPEQQQAREEMERQRQELEDRREQLAERQENLERDTGEFLEKMREMREQLEESNPQISQQLENMRQQLMEQGLMREMAQASQSMRQGQMQQSQQHQQNAQQQLQQMADQMQNQMANMGMQNLQEDMMALSRLIERGLFLSDNLEGLAGAESGEINARRAILRAGAYIRETGRILEEWRAAAETNPFMSREVDRLLSLSSERLNAAVDAGQGEKWVALHESRQSLGALNDALLNMRQDQQQMMQQMMQSSMDQMQQQMQQMISQQQNLNQMMEQMRQMGEQGQQMMQRLQQLAQQQAQIRREIEKMMRDFRQARQLRNQLEGIRSEMEEAERMMREGLNNEELSEKQRRILTRMLDAGTYQEKDEYGKERQAEAARTGLDAESPEGPPSIPMEERAQQAATRPDAEDIPPQFREAIKEYYTRLAEVLGE